MTTHPIPANANLLDLVELNLKWDIEDSCLDRKLRRLSKWSARARKSAETRRANSIASATAFKRPLVETKGEMK